MTDKEIARVAQVEKVNPKAWNHRASERDASHGLGAQNGRRLTDEQLAQTADFAKAYGHKLAAEKLGISAATVKDRVENYRKRQAASESKKHSDNGREQHGRSVHGASSAETEVRALSPAPLLRIEEIAEHLGISRSMAWKIIADGRLRSVRIGKAIRVLPADLEAYSEHGGDRETPISSTAPNHRENVSTGEPWECSTALNPLLDWLAEHGPAWSQAEAERWFKAFTATIDLVYPTRAETAA